MSLRSVRLAEGEPGALAFFVRGLPITQGSKKPMNHPRTGKAFMVEDRKAELLPWRQLVGTVARIESGRSGFRLIERGAVELRLEFYLPRLKKHDGEICTADDAAFRPDLDKLERAIMDSLTRVVYRDDGQVTDKVSRKRIAEPGEPTGVRVRVSRVLT